MLSGIAAAEAAYDAIRSGRRNDTLTLYEQNLRSGPIGQDLSKRLGNDTLI